MNKYQLTLSEDAIKFISESLTYTAFLLHGEDEKPSKFWGIDGGYDE